MLVLNKSDIPDHLLKYFKPRDVIKPKDEIDTPNMVCEALRRDGWYRRQTIIWSKPNPIPESVTDRCTKAHEYVFLLTKQARYYYDAIAIQETSTGHDGIHTFGKNGNGDRNDDGRSLKREEMPTRNRRSVWTVATSPYSGAHFATFPPALIEPMILAGTSARGECPHCGKAWVRVVEVERSNQSGWAKAGNPGGRGKYGEKAQGGGVTSDIRMGPTVSSTTIGWRQQCSCPPHEPIPQTVLDLFAGSGTTGAVAVKRGRRAVLLDLNTKYIDLQFERTNGVQMMFETIAPNPPA